MKKLFLIVTLFSFYKAQSQISNAQQLIRLHNMSNTANLNAMNNLASGHLAYNVNDKKVYKYDGTNWLPVGSLIDKDKDTYVLVDNGSDNDLVNFTIQNINSFAMRPSRLEFLNTNGSVSIGEQASLANTSNQELNVFVGIKSGTINSTGYRNTGVGTRSLRSNTSGTRNTAVGNKSLVLNTSGSENAALGNYALYSNTNGYENSAIGSSSLGNVTTGYKNSGIGSLSLEEVTSGDRNTGLGYGTLFSVTTGNNNVGVGNRADIGGNYNNRVRIGNYDIQYGSMQVAWSVSSDSTWKRDIKPLKYGLDIIKNLEVFDYIRKTDDKTEELGREIGFIAQKLIKNLNEIGYKDQGFVRNENGTYSVRYNDFIPLAIKGIQQQQSMIDELKEENLRLREILLNFENRLQELEAKK